LAFIERHAQILRILSRLKSVSVQTLTERLQVSEVTIRKDLSYLEEQGRLLRTHGGAVLSEDLDHLRTLPMRRNDHIRRKRAIAARARRLIREEDTIYIDAGSTCALLAAEIHDMSLRVVTNSIDVMVALSASEQVSLISPGGSYRREAGSFIGPMAVAALNRLQIETCFLGTTGFSEGGDFSSMNLIEAELKRKAIERSARCVVLADRAKFGVGAFTVFASAGDVDILVVDDGFEHAKRIEALGIEVLRASMDSEEEGT
jgi:DeoR/GlpR family transcriptional regulator of sugar metabolism